MWLGGLEGCKPSKKNPLSRSYWRRCRQYERERDYSGAAKPRANIEKAKPRRTAATGLDLPQNGLLDGERALHAGDIVAREGTQEDVVAGRRRGERGGAGLAAVEQLDARYDVRVGRDIASGLAGSRASVVDLLRIGIGALDQHPVMLLGRRAVLECDLDLPASCRTQRGWRELERLAGGADVQVRAPAPFRPTTTAATRRQDQRTRQRHNGKPGSCFEIHENSFI